MIYSTKADVVRLAGCVPDSSVDGVGVRYVLFFQGCAHACKGCHNPQTHAWDATGAHDIAIESIIADFKESAVASRVTISGGEPFGQPQALLALLKAFKDVGVTDIWLYTGYTWEEINANSLFKEVLCYVTTVVTGRFIESETQGAPLFAGSANQEIHSIQGGF